MAGCMLWCLQVYKDYRNFMINKYREDVKRTLTFTECKKLLAGMPCMPMSVVTSVHNALEMCWLKQTDTGQTCHMQTHLRYMCHCMFKPWRDTALHRQSVVVQVCWTVDMLCCR